jgi:hypothetical protein
MLQGGSPLLLELGTPTLQRFSCIYTKTLVFDVLPAPLQIACASTHLYPPPHLVVGVSPPWLPKTTLRPERSGFFRFSGCRFPRIRAFSFANSGCLLSLYVLNHTFGWAKSFFWRMRWHPLSGRVLIQRLLV